MTPKDNFTRAASKYNYSEYASFDASSKTCTMNCGKHKDDPRDEKERKFVCKDCINRDGGVK